MGTLRRILSEEGLLRKGASVLYHVPVTGRIERGPIKAHPLSSSPARRSETSALKEDLEAEGWDPESPVVWLSPGAPVSRTGVWYALDASKLEKRRLIPTFQSGGYLLHVGDIPQAAVLETGG